MLTNTIMVEKINVKCTMFTYYTFQQGMSKRLLFVTKRMHTGKCNIWMQNSHLSRYILLIQPDINESSRCPKKLRG